MKINSDKWEEMSTTPNHYYIPSLAYVPVDLGIKLYPEIGLLMIRKNEHSVKNIKEAETIVDSLVSAFYEFNICMQEN